MTFAITIGSYKLPQFVELCALRCRRLFGEETPILISDDFSERSKDIEAMANRHGFAYVCSNGRQSHFGGDMKAVLNAIEWGQHADITMKISQRFIPVLPEFRDAALRAFSDKNMQLGLPGQLLSNQIARPQAAFYRGFGILTDVIAMRTGALTSQELLDTYVSRVRRPKRHSDCFVETTIGWLVANKFNGQHAMVKEWTRHEPTKPKVYLRKSQSNPHEYLKVAQMEGVKGEWDLREWGQIERNLYMPRPLA